MSFRLSLDRAPGRLDDLAGAGGHLQSFDCDGLVQCSRGDDLYALGALADQTRGLQRGQIRTLARECLELVHAQLGRKALRPGYEADFRQAPLHRHLAAFETDLVVAARARALTLGTTATGLAETRSRAASAPLVLSSAAVGRFERVQHLKPPRSAACT